ncbi:hypothetical protein F5B21DRAFT_497476 [Xylaria acuta]|nr:hypothetical protein F5B21DRAFT_497476 [Xylaria acuta]
MTRQPSHQVPSSSRSLSEAALQDFPDIYEIIDGLDDKLSSPPRQERSHQGGGDDDRNGGHDVQDGGGNVQDGGGDVKLQQLSKLRDHLDFLNNGAPCPRCTFQGKETRDHYLRSCSEGRQEAVLTKAIMDNIRAPDLGLHINSGCFTCGMPKAWCIKWDNDDRLPLPLVKCQWKMSFWEMVAVILSSHPALVDSAITALGGPGPLSRESTPQSPLGDSIAHDSVSYWLRDGTTLTGPVRASNIALVIAQVFAQVYQGPGR